jgi:hypothetical protein
MRVSGEGTDGYYIVEHSGTADTLSVPADIRLLLTAPGLGESWFFGLVSFHDSPVVDELTGLNGGPGGGVDPNFLLGEMVTAEMYMQFDYDIAWIDPLVTLTAASVVLEVEPLAGDSRTWSGLKALYR